MPKTRARRTGSRNLLLASCLLGLALAQGAAQSKKAPEPYALIAGTIFRDSGFALPGADVNLSPDTPPGERSKIKKQKVLSNFRGEFSFRVPALPMRYNVSAKASGYRMQVKSVSISGDERVDVSIQLDPEK